MTTPCTYRCANCGGTFTLGWSDEEAKAELSQNFPGTTTDDCEIVCDDCYKRILGHDA